MRGEGEGVQDLKQCVPTATESSPPVDAVPPYPWRRPPRRAGASAALRGSGRREGRQLGLSERRSGERRR